MQICKKCNRIDKYLIRLFEVIIFELLLEIELIV